MSSEYFCYAKINILKKQNKKEKEKEREKEKLNKIFLLFNL